jgi:hypothetical protein
MLVRCFTVLVGLPVAALALASFAQAEDVQGSTAFSIDNLRVRVGLPRVVRNPGGPGIDMTFSEIKLPDGRFRGFLGAGWSYAIDGAAPWDMGGQTVEVLKPGGPGSMARCGQSLMHVERAGKTVARDLDGRRPYLARRRFHYHREGKRQAHCEGTDRRELRQRAR